MIYVGTSGYGYHEWSPTFYPPELCYEDFLSHYSREFRSCELTSTFFCTPSADVVENWVERVADEFRFTVKLDRRLTHERELTLARGVARALEPLVESEKLGAVLAQFPFSFVNNPENRAYLCRLRAALELPLVAELRNDTWLKQESFDFLRGWGIGFAAIDAPHLGGFMPPTAAATSDIGYVRFHGRDASSWSDRDGSDRYAYRYRQRELLSWVPRIREIARRCRNTFVFFNNHRFGNAVDNARTLARLMQRSSRRASRLADARAG